MRSVCYKYKCKKCGMEYIGETNRNVYTRDGDHTNDYEKKKPNTFQYSHQCKKHPGERPEFHVSVIKQGFESSFSRQVFEGVQIRRSGAEAASDEREEVLNSRENYWQQGTYEVVRQVVRG